MKYVDPDGKVVLLSSKKAGNQEYSILTYTNGSGYCHYVTKLLSNFIPFGGFLINIEQGLNSWLSEDYDYIYDTDAINSLNLSFILDFAGCSKYLKSYKSIFDVFKLYSKAQGIRDVLGISQDQYISSFLNNVKFYMFNGILNDDDAIELCNLYIQGINFYKKNNLSIKGINENQWTTKIHDAFIKKEFTNFEELLNE